MAAYWLWWILALVLVAAELFTGSFYFLALAAAFALGGIAAWLGTSTAAQLAIAGGLAVVGVFVAHRWRRKRGAPSEPVPFDIGQAVRVQAWHADGSARVAYRGSLWTAQPESAQTPQGETMYIVAMKGSTLIVGDRKPSASA